MYDSYNKYNVGPPPPRTSLLRQFTDTNVYGTGSVKIWKTHHKISVIKRIFFKLRFKSSPLYSINACPRERALLFAKWQSAVYMNIL